MDIYRWGFHIALKILQLRVHQCFPRRVISWRRRRNAMDEGLLPGPEPKYWGEQAVYHATPNVFNIIGYPVYSCVVRILNT